VSALGVWYTSEDGKRYRLSRQPDLGFMPASPGGAPGEGGDRIIHAWFTDRAWSTDRAETDGQTQAG
jgi:hypothetical protein